MASLTATGRQRWIELEARSDAKARALLEPLTERQRSCAASTSLKAMARPAALDAGPLVTFVRTRTVEEVDSIGFEVFKWILC